MLSKLLKRVKAFFKREVASRGAVPYMAIGDMDGGVTIRTQAQLDKRTHFKPGDTYKLGECIVTVHKNKASMLAAIAATDARRAAREAAMRERAIDIMLMSPEELKQFKVNDWLKERAEKDSIIKSIIDWGTRRYIAPKGEQIEGTIKGRFEQLIKEAVKEKVE
jgi:hypothetical protein